MARISVFSLARNALSGHRDWTPMWRDAAPREAYDAVIVGGGGHGLATAYYSPLCRARHSGICRAWNYAVRRNPMSAKALSMICSA
jgi:hypothetical protein